MKRVDFIMVEMHYEGMKRDVKICIWLGAVHYTRGGVGKGRRRDAAGSSTCHVFHA